MIEIVNATKKYRNKTVVKRVSATLNEGCLTAFIGGGDQRQMAKLSIWIQVPGTYPDMVWDLFQPCLMKLLVH